MIFFPGWHRLNHLKLFERVMFSVNLTIGRKSRFFFNDAIMDSGAFTRISSGKGHLDTAEYALRIDDIAQNGRLLCAVAQDYMCEPFILKKTGLTVKDHQRMTTERYVDLLGKVESGTYIMPVIQGYLPEEYAAHIQMYGDLLGENMWVGVGSVCKRNSRPHMIQEVLEAILGIRPDLKLHGFGVKTTALSVRYIRESFYSADSMASSFRARMSRRHEGTSRSANDPHEAIAFTRKLEAICSGREANASNR